MKYKKKKKSDYITVEEALDGKNGSIKNDFDINEEVIEVLKLDIEDITYSDEEIEQFLEECGKSPQFSITEFNQSVVKDTTDINYRDLRILVSKVGWLSDDERYKFKNLLVMENLTSDEIVRYTRIYPSNDRFAKIFPAKEKVEENYINNFKQGR